MIKLEPFEQYTELYDRWFDDHEFVFESEMTAIREQMSHLPENIRGLEVGLGTGRYADALGIKEGVEPALHMRILAARRGVEVMDAVGEHLPYKDLQFDFVLFVTICQLDSLEKSLNEAYRVLKKNGSVIVGFIDKNGIIGKTYEQNKAKSTFYKHAQFYSPVEVVSELKNARFRNLSFVQTLFGDLNSIQTIQEPMSGIGNGSYIVVRATK